MDRLLTFFSALAYLFVVSCGSAQVEAPPESEFDLPEGFRMQVYAEGVTNARAMYMGDEGTLFVGSNSAGNVYAVLDEDNDHHADTVLTIASGLSKPVGVAFKDGDLYVSAISKVYRLENIESSLYNPPQPVVAFDNYPTDGHHGWKFIDFGPDGKLYVPVGAPCNICLSNDSIYASITRINTDGSGREIVAHGVRNTVGFDWHPETGTLYFSDNGRDWLGDDEPPCELNKLSYTGEHFGYPFCHGGYYSDPEYGDQAPCSEFTDPLQNLGPHVAPLGIHFYEGDMFPAEYKNQVFIAEHGSWNRSTKIGYRVTLVGLDNGGSTGYETFASGWLNNGEVKGRPVDVTELDDGSLLVSDDHGGRIYRIYYEP